MPPCATANAPPPRDQLQHFRAAPQARTLRRRLRAPPPPRPPRWCQRPVRIALAMSGGHSTRMTPESQEPIQKTEDGNHKKREERREKREERREKREERRESHTSVDVRRPQPAEKVLSGAGGGGWLQVWLQLGRLAWSPARLLERPGQQPPGLCRPVQRDRPGLVQVRRQSTTQRWARAGGEKERGQQQQDMKAVRGRVAVG